MSEKLSVRPYGNKILVVEIDKEKSSASDLIVFGSAMGSDNKFVKGLVVAVGDPIPNLAGILIQPNINVGDVVVYNKFNALELKHENKNYKVLPYHEVQAILIEDTSKYITSDESLIPRNTKNMN